MSNSLDFSRFCVKMTMKLSYFSFLTSVEILVHLLWVLAKDWEGFGLSIVLHHPDFSLEYLVNCKYRGLLHVV